MTAALILITLAALILFIRKISNDMDRRDPGICQECGGHKTWPGHRPGEKPAVCPNNCKK